MAVLCATRISAGFLRPVCGRYSDRINPSSVCWNSPSTSHPATRRAPTLGSCGGGTFIRGARTQPNFIGACWSDGDRASDTELFCISHQNIGLAMKKKLPSLLSSKKNLADVIVWTEIGLRHGDDASITEVARHLSDEYDAFFNCRRNCSRASGGVAILVRKGARFQEDASISHELDWLLAGKLLVPGRREPLGVIGCYIPHKSSVYFKEDMFDRLGSTFVELSKSCSGVVVLGDINKRLGDGQGCPDRSYLSQFRRRAKDTQGKDGSFLDAFSNKFGVYFLNGRIPGNIPAKTTNALFENDIKVGGTEVDYVMVDHVGFCSAVNMNVGKVNKRISSHSEVSVHFRLNDVLDGQGTNNRDL